MDDSLFGIGIAFCQVLDSNEIEGKDEVNSLGLRLPLLVLVTIGWILVTEWVVEGRGKERSTVKGRSLEANGRISISDR